MTEQEASYLESILPAVEFDFDTVEGRRVVDVLAALAALVAWAGSSRVRLGVIGAALGQDTRRNADIAKDLKCSPAAVSIALREARSVISHLTREA